MSSGQIRARTAQLRATARRHRHDRFPLSPSASGRPWRARLVRLLLVRPLLAFLLLLVRRRLSAGQPIAFGKNKVQYSDFEWRLLESEHFQPHFYEGKRSWPTCPRRGRGGVSRSAGQVRARGEGADPLIIYSSHQDFEQTNITPYFLPEGLAGLTEFARGRVLIPYGGSWPEFRTTLVHELVHVFQRSYLDETFSTLLPTGRPRAAALVHRGIGGPLVGGARPRGRHGAARSGPERRAAHHRGVLALRRQLHRLQARAVDARLHRPPLRRRSDSPLLSRPLALADLRGGDRGSARHLGPELSARWAFDLKERYFPEVEEAEPAAFASRPLTRAGQSSSRSRSPTACPGCRAASPSSPAAMGSPTSISPRATGRRAA